MGWREYYIIKVGFRSCDCAKLLSCLIAMLLSQIATIFLDRNNNLIILNYLTNLHLLLY